MLVAPTEGLDITLRMDYRTASMEKNSRFNRSSRGHRCSVDMRYSLTLDDTPRENEQANVQLPFRPRQKLAAVKSRKNAYPVKLRR